MSARLAGSLPPANTGLDESDTSNASCATTATLTGSGWKMRSARARRESRCSSTTSCRTAVNGETCWRSVARATNLWSAAATFRRSDSNPSLEARTISSGALHGSAPCASAASSCERRQRARILTSRRPATLRGSSETPWLEAAWLMASGRRGGAQQDIYGLPCPVAAASGKPRRVIGGVQTGERGGKPFV
jgi:hypothetical protein